MSQNEYTDSTRSESVQRLERLKLLREEIRFEHNLVGNRIARFGSTQAFLFTAFAISAASNGSYDRFNWFSYRFLPTLGVALCIAIFPAIIGAMVRIARLRTLFRQSDPAMLLPISGFWFHHLSLLFAWLSPLIFLAGWLWIAFIFIR